MPPQPPPSRPRGPRVATHTVGAYAVAAAANGRLFAVGLGDGRVLLFDSETPEGEPTSIAAHKGGALSLCADITPGGFLSGGDDGKVVRIAPPTVSEVLAEVKGRWIDHVAATAVTGFRAYASGKDLTILDKKGAARTVGHFTAVGGIAINPKGRRIAASHYNGVSLWWLAQEGTPTVLEWKGSHLALAWSPDGDYVLSTMQENSLHGWRLSDGEHMRMSGYGAKVRALAFTRRGNFLATAGADTVICWPFTGGGPMGKAPTEFGGAGGAPVTMVAANPKLDVVAAGFENGAIIVGQPGTAGAMPVVPPNGTPVTAMVWNPDGDKLLAGTEAGDITIADFRV